jgi:hypothetical protein
MIRPCVAACVFAVWSAVAYAQLGQVPVQPAGGGFPSLPGALTPPSNIPFTPEQDRIAMKHRRMMAYQKMRSDTREIQALAKDLDDRMHMREASGTEQVQDQKATELALKEAHRIQKLAADVDRLMRQD